jgi:CRP/FNR family transcriptional regulator
MTDSHTEVLRGLDLFAGLDDDGLGAVAAVATEVEVKAGHVFVERGHPAAGCFVVLDGTVEVVLGSGRTIERGPGEVIGELSVLTDTVRSARVHALTDAHCIAISRDDVLALIEREPSVAVGMLKAVAQRLVEMT